LTAPSHRPLDRLSPLPSGSRPRPAHIAASRYHHARQFQAAVPLIRPSSLPPATGLAACTHCSQPR
jgi:hypothetical protein